LFFSPLDEAPGFRIWFHQQQNMHTKSKGPESEVSTTAMSSEMNNFLFLEAREGTDKEACTHQQALHLNRTE